MQHPGQRIEHADIADSINRRSVYAILIFLFIAGHAGGLGIAPLAAIIGCVGMFSLDYRLAKGRLTRIIKTPWVMALAVFMGWAWLTTLWSPHESKGLPNAFKLTLGLIFFEAGRRAIKRAATPALVAPQSPLQSLMIYLPLIAALILCLDLLSGFNLTFAIDPPSAGEDVERKRGDAVMNTANGIVLLTLMAPASFIIMLWSRYRGPIFAVLLLAVITACAIVNGLNVALIALFFSISAMLLAAFYPKPVLRIITGFAISLIGFAPLIAAAASMTSSGARAALPFSWEHRLVTWSHIGERIREHPLIGHGFDASRTFDATFDARGFTDLAVVSLHPHNAGLQIWVETGVVGAVLACVLIYHLGKEAVNFASGGRARAMAAAGLSASVLVVLCVSYGVWQHWLWAMLFMCAGVLMLVPRTRRGAGSAA